MNIAELSIKRPIFITCVFIVILGIGYLSLMKMPVDMFPDVTFPVVVVTTPYPGAGPAEVETLVSKPIEDELSSVSGVKSIRSTNKEGLSLVIAEFTFETDLKYAEQQVRDKVSLAKRRLPNEAEDSVVRSVNPADQPIMSIGIAANLKTADLYDFAQEVIRPKIQQVNQVGNVEVWGGRRREIRVSLDQKKLKDFEVSANAVTNRLALAGENVPSGKVDEGAKQFNYRTLAEFQSLKDIGATIVRFFANENPVRVQDVATVTDGLEDETTRVFVNGENGLILQVFRQSKANTVAVVDALYKRVESLSNEYKDDPRQIRLTVLRDNARAIRANVVDVVETILVGIVLVVIVVLFFLGNLRSTLITGLALPTSLLGAFVFMSSMGFSINVMTLLALVLVVGLLIDDAIVVRENIFRHIELGEQPRKAAIVGTNEVLLAVVATTLTVIAVFGPIGFLSGMVGQFFKEFGLTICIVMLISLFDAVTMAPMLSAYFAGSGQHKEGLWDRTMGKALRAFDRFQTRMESYYEGVLHKVTKRPSIPLIVGVLLFVASLVSAKFIPKTFLPAAETGEFLVTLDLPAGTSLDGTAETVKKADEIIRSYPEVEQTLRIVGSGEGEPNKAYIFAKLTHYTDRKATTTELKARARKDLESFASARPIVMDINAVGGGDRPFTLIISGTDLKQLEEISGKVYERLKSHPALLDVDVTNRPGKPEFQFKIDPEKAERYGVSSKLAGAEIRTLVEGATPAVFRENGLEYDVRVRLEDDQRSLKDRFAQTYVPNMNDRLVPAKAVSSFVEAVGPAEINRRDRTRYISIGADIAPDGPGMGGAIEAVESIFKKEVTLPAGVSYRMIGQAEDFADLMKNMILAVVLGVFFIFLVLASLYESFITPLTIMLVLPLAICGALFALLMTGKSLDIFSMIGCVLLMGVATKNSILLVDYANQQIAKGVDTTKAIIEAGKIRLRPIIMTSFALIAGMIPVAIGLNEASRQRTSMGVAILGGLISSTFLTLLVIPAAYTYMERFRSFVEGGFKRMITPKNL